MQLGPTVVPQTDFYAVRLPLHKLEDSPRPKANFFKATLSSSRKVKVNPATLAESAKIGSAEAKPASGKIGVTDSKPVTRNRPRTAPHTAEAPRTGRTPRLTSRERVPSVPPRPRDQPKPRLTKNINNNDVWSDPPPPRQPVKSASTEKKSIVNARKGPSQASGGKGPEPLKGAPSVSSLDSKHHKIAPAKEKSHKLFGSKEKLDKGSKRRERYGWNNNSVAEERSAAGGVEEEEYESAEEVRGAEDGMSSQECVSLPVTLNSELHLHAVSEASLIASSMQELEALRRELEATAREKAALQARLEELAQRAAETDDLRAQLDNMKVVERQRLASLERLADENGALRARLRGVAHSPLSDSEKRQLLLQPTHNHRMHSSAPASIALAHTAEGESGEASTPDWDKHSSSSLSEVSVACLQDRILQMEENHYSTSEELQATLAELADLQSALAEAQSDNERLADEKQVLLESLCRQTEKLEDSRSKVDTLQEMLLREGEPEPHLHRAAAPADTDQQLLLMLKIAQDDRRMLLAKQEQLNAEIAEQRTIADDKTKENERLCERIRTLEGCVERLEDERGQWEREANAAREAAASRQHQLSTLSQLLDQAKTKLSSLEEALAERAEGASAAAAAEAAEARRDAEAAAARAHQLAERLAHAQRQLDRAHTDARKLHDDHLVSRNNAKSTISELEFQAEQLRQEKAALQTELAALQESHAQLQVQCQVVSEEKLSLVSRATEALSRAGDTERQLQDARARYAQLARDRERDEAEWKQFQADLLMTVRVANDFKTEAQRELERLVTENKAARDKIRALEDQIHNMKVPAREEPPPPPPLLTSASLQDIMATATSHRRNKGVSRQDSRLSVKSLIESIENAAKVAKQQHAAAVTAGATSPSTTPTPDWPQSNLSVSSSSSSSIKNGLELSPSTAPTNGLASPGATYSAAGKPPAPSRPARTIMLNSEGGGAGQGGSPPANMPDEQRQALATAMQQKAIESFVRRNSYGDICERKDPLNALQVKNGGSKRNALLKWCQQKTIGYKNIDITNFSSSWNDGLALCALLHSYLGADRIPYDALTPTDKRTNFSVAFAAAEAVGVPTTLNIQDMIQQERPDWQQVMAYVTSVYKHFET